MKSPRAAFAMVGFLWGAAMAHAAGASNPIDGTQRNETIAAEPAIRPEVRAKRPVESLQARRVDFPALAQTPSPAADRRALLDMSEARPKSVLPADVRPPAARTLPLNALSHRLSGFDPKDRLASPPLVSKYQDSLRAAASLRPGRSPVIEKPGWFARLNRFVFQRNHPPATAAPVVSVSAGKPAQP